jgi:hypothetical protein
LRCRFGRGPVPFPYEPLWEVALCGTADPGGPLEALEGDGDGIEGRLLLVAVCRYGGGGRLIFCDGGFGLLATTVAIASQGEGEWISRGFEASDLEML